MTTVYCYVIGQKHCDVTASDRKRRHSATDGDLLQEDILLAVLLDL